MSQSPHAVKVSVTVVTFNHGEFLSECLESLVTQTTSFAFEVIVGDDCSTDGVTRETLRHYAEAYPNIIVPVLRDRNIGVTANYFDLIQRARGEYIAHVDGDDLAKPGKLQALADFLDSRQECVMVGHQCDVIDKNGVFLRIFSRKRHPLSFDISYLLVHHAVFPHSSIMYRSCYRQELVYDGNERLDLYVYMCIAQHGQVGYLRDSYGRYRSGVGIASKGIPRKYVIEALAKASNCGVTPAALSLKRSQLFISWAYGAYKNQDYSEYLACTLQSLKEKIYSIDQFVYLLHSLMWVCLGRSMQRNARNPRRENAGSAVSDFAAWGGGGSVDTGAKQTPESHPSDARPLPNEK